MRKSGKYRFREVSGEVHVIRPRLLESSLSLLLRGLPTEAFTLAKTLLSRVVKHGVSQQPIRFGLVTAAIGFEPCNDVGI